VLASSGVFSNDAPSITEFVVSNSSQISDRTGKTILVGAVDETLSMQATAIDAGGADGLEYEWAVFESDADDAKTKRSIASSTGTAFRFQPGKPGRYKVELRVEDKGFFGLSRKSDVRIHHFTARQALPPKARILISSTDIRLGELISTSAETSVIEARNPMYPEPEFNWVLSRRGDVQETQRGEKVKFKPTEPGDYSLRLTMKDSYGQSAEASSSFLVRAPSLPSPSIRAERLTVSPGEAVLLEGRPNDDRYRLAWFTQEGIVGRPVSSSATFEFSSIAPGIHPLTYAIFDQWNGSKSTVQRMEVLRSTVLDPDHFEDAGDGARIFDYSGQEIVLVGTLYTGGKRTVLRAHTIRSEGGAILSFPDDATGTPGRAGNNGRPGSPGRESGSDGARGADGEFGARGADGAAAGDLVLIAERLFGDLEIMNNGMTGGPGGQGGSGGRGGDGQNGRAGASGAFDCSRGPQDGGDGGPGGNAGRGGDAGDGGHGGKVTISLAEIEEGATLRVSATGGRPGAIGLSGERGAGGSGRPRGSAPGLCTQTASNGSNGSRGAAAPNGEQGQRGSSAVISLTVGSENRVATGTLRYIAE
jgi:hypothetical protein